MKGYLPVLLIFLVTSPAWGKESLCEALNFDDCDKIHRMSRRSSARSLPSTASAAQFNPANVSHDRGFGVEAFHDPGNPVTLNFVTGTGKAGAALVSAGLENAFFGNRVPERGNELAARIESKRHYRSEKHSLALGAAAFKRKNFGFDLGVMGKYNQATSRANPGAGLAMRLGPLTMGASVYQDDYLLNFAQPYHETFTVQSYFAGLMIGNISLDAGLMQTHYRFYGADQTIRIFSASYIWQKFLFTLAHRSETIPVLDPVESIYTGIQYSINRYIVGGLHYNYFLLEEMSMSVAVFF
jgi:hypothetical protein